MARNRRSRDHLRLTLLAGWLFADLFVVLFIIGVASGAVPVPRPSPTRTPSASPTPTPTVSPTPSRTPTPARSTPARRSLMQPKPDQTDVPFGSGDEGNLLASLENYVKGRGKAGFVLVFFPGPSAGPAQSAAQAFYDDLPSEDPAVFGSSTGEGLWGGDVGYVEFQIFFLG